MNSLRSRLIVAILFGFISLGQAYPYSYAWALGREARCGCNLSGRKCIHGCELKKKKGHDHHHAHSHAPKKIQGCHESQEDPSPEWVSPRCSQQGQREALSFQGDPFLLVRVALPETVFFFRPLTPFLIQPHPLIFTPDPPPPRTA